jgi:hypothetical protein
MLMDTPDWPVTEDSSLSAMVVMAMADRGNTKQTMRAIAFNIFFICSPIFFHVNWLKALRSLVCPDAERRFSRQPVPGHLM